MKKKTILIVGDSWGVPNYAKGWDVSPDVHTEYRLREMGYDVYNFSLNGGSMLETLEYAKLAISKRAWDNQIENIINHKRRTYSTDDTYKDIPVPNYAGQSIDWVLWFHTEALRDFDAKNLSYRYMPFKEVQDMSLKAAYTSFVELINMIGPKVKTAVIGGQAIVDPMFYTYHKPTFIIEDWRSELVGRKLPTVTTLSRVDWIENACLTTEEKLQILENHSIVLDAMIQSNLFFDNCHPGSEAHERLTQILHNLFQAG